MKKVNAVLLSLIPMVVMLFVPTTTSAQHKHGQTGRQKAGMAGMKSEMAKMMQSPHHKLMMAYMKSMSAFASALREQAMKVQGLDVDAARATVAELRHNLDAMEALHQKHMQSMSADMQSKMQMMMGKMDKDRAMIKDQIGTLETDVQVERPDAAQIRTHANALIRHLGMMSNMHGRSKAGTKKPTGMKMDMKM